MSVLTTNGGVCKQSVCSALKAMLNVTKTAGLTLRNTRLNSHF